MKYCCVLISSLIGHEWSHLAENIPYTDGELVLVQAIRSFLEVLTSVFYHSLPNKKESCAVIVILTKTLHHMSSGLFLPTLKSCQR